VNTQYSFRSTALKGDAVKALQQFWGVAKLVKAPDFDSGMRRFESFLLSQIVSGRLAVSAGLPELF
jgi:hypothetical protein